MNEGFPVLSLFFLLKNVDVFTGRVLIETCRSEYECYLQAFFWTYEIK